MRREGEDGRATEGARRKVVFPWYGHLQHRATTPRSSLRVGTQAQHPDDILAIFMDSGVPFDTCLEMPWGEDLFQLDRYVE